MSDIGTEEEFDLFGPMSSPRGDSFWEYQETLAFPLEFVWTIVDDGGATQSLYASPGYHVVNKQDYVVTTLPWTDPAKDYYWYQAE